MRKSGRTKGNSRLTPKKPFIFETVPYFSASSSWNSQACLLKILSKWPTSFKVSKISLGSSFQAPVPLINVPPGGPGIADNEEGDVHIHRHFHRTYETPKIRQRSKIARAMAD